VCRADRAREKARKKGRTPSLEDLLSAEVLRRSPRGSFASGMFRQGGALTKGRKRKSLMGEEGVTNLQARSIRGEDQE